MAGKRKCPECKTGHLNQSKWTGDWHCDNMHCTVTIKADGSIHHRNIAPADMGRKRERLAEV